MYTCVGYNRYGDLVHGPITHENACAAYAVEYFVNDEPLNSEVTTVGVCGESSFFEIMFEISPRRGRNILVSERR